MTLSVKIPAPVQSTTIAVWSLSEENMKAALIEARGDIFVGSQMLGVTALRLHRAIQVSPLLQATQAAILQANTDPEFERLSGESLRVAVESRLALYRVVGLDALHDIAVMPISENSAQNQVKLAAAARLAGSTDGISGGGEIGETLRSLNELYHQHAPRIRIVRETLTIEAGPHENEIQGESLPPQSDG